MASKCDDCERKDAALVEAAEWLQMLWCVVDMPMGDGTRRMLDEAMELRKRLRAAMKSKAGENGRCCARSSAG
ncbi:MAG TPA: hypothetical protein VFK80_04700 [Limnochordia bacterium]|nr:hypothetical protein [Limnochordia bacterium]